MDINMKNLKKKYRFLLSAIIFGMVFTMLFGLQGCAVLTLIGGKSSEVQSGAAEGQQGYDSAQGNNGRESGTPGKGSNAENGNGEQAAGAPDNSGNGSETQDGATDDLQNASGAQDTNTEPVFITYIGEDSSFAFQYPANRLTLSSNVFAAAGAGDLILSIMKQRPDSLNSSYYYFDKQKIQEDIAALKEGKFGADIEYSYKPSQKVIERDGRFLKEFVIFSRSDCDVCFERVIVFYDGEVQYLLVLQGGVEKFKGSLSDYLVTDNKDCQGPAAWGKGKIDELYKKLAEGSAPEKIQQWYDSFDEISAGITFDSLKIANLKSNGNIAVTGKSIYDNMPEYKTELTAYYPVFEDFKTTGYFDAVNSHIKDILDPWFAYFMESVKATLKDMPADAPWIFQLQADYAVEYYSGKILSLSFTDYTFTGGAHGSTISSTYNYDLVNNKDISLSDIFKPGSGYLSFLSDYCFEDIKRQNVLMGMDSMEDMIKPGIDPLVPENFERFLLAADSLAIRFDQYQVGPGAAGSYIVRIGYEKLKDLIDEDYTELLLK
jgi:hypothetical protein